MAVMEILRQNQINTSTQFTFVTMTGTSDAIFDNNPRIPFFSSGFTAGTSSAMRIDFSPAVILSNVMVLNHNVKSLHIALNTTTNFIFTDGFNSATSTYVSFASVTTSMLYFTLTENITGTGERQLGEVIATERLYQFERNPDIADFKYNLERKQIRHVMPDGGVVLYNVRDKYKTTIKCEFFSAASLQTLENIYRDAAPVTFVPEPTTTAWDGKAYQCVWPGRFDFKYATNGKQAGYTGSITLEETPGA